MNLNLTIDQGNSTAKIALFDGDELIKSERIENLHLNKLREILTEYKPQGAIYSSVRCKDEEIENELSNSVPKFISLSAETAVPINIEYKSKNSLGIDRIAAAVGATVIAPGQNVVVIDAGTAITLDVVSKEGAFLGGNISPGLSMRFEALHQYTAKLPLVDIKGDIPLIGYDTITAIRAGVVQGVIGEIERFVAEIKSQMGDLTVIITGGDTRFLVKQIKMPIFGDENLLAKGLNRILLYEESI